MMSVLGAAVRELWEDGKTEIAAAGRTGWDPSSFFVLPTTDLIITLIEQRVSNLNTIRKLPQKARELEALSKKAALYPVADDILIACLPDYRPMATNNQFELMDETNKAKKSWWQFW